jgi:polyhydroxyalkanoate synthesis regulator phasin
MASSLSLLEGAQPLFKDTYSIRTINACDGCLGKESIAKPSPTEELNAQIDDLTKQVEKVSKAFLQAIEVFRELIGHKCGEPLEDVGKYSEDWKTCESRNGRKFMALNFGERKGQLFERAIELTDEVELLGERQLKEDLASLNEVFGRLDIKFKRAQLGRKLVGMPNDFLNEQKMEEMAKLRGKYHRLEQTLAQCEDNCVRLSRSLDARISVLANPKLNEKKPSEKSTLRTRLS